MGVTFQDSMKGVNYQKKKKKKVDIKKRLILRHRCDLPSVKLGPLTYSFLRYDEPVMPFVIILNLCL